MTAPPPPTIEFAEEFIHAIDASKATKRTYRAALQRLARFLADAGGAASGKPIPLTRLRRETLVDFRQWLAEDALHGGQGYTLTQATPQFDYNTRTIRNSLVAVGRFLTWLDVTRKLPAGLIAHDMQAVLKNAKGSRRLSYRPKPVREAVPLIVEYFAKLPVPKPENDRAARKALTILRNCAVTRTLFSAGLRAQELASLKRGEWDSDYAVVRVMGKGEKPRTVGVDDETQKALRAYLNARDEYYKASRYPAREPLFARHDPGARVTAGLQPITTKTVWQVIATAAQALKADGYEIADSISPHDFRRYIATSMLSEGMKLELVQDFLGHASPETTRVVYAHTWDEALEDAVSTYRPSLSNALERAKRKIKSRGG
jgi:site-specific recombinase XerD